MERLKPIERPKGLKMRLAYWMTRRKFGKVMTPIKVVTARIPESLRNSYETQKFQMKGIKLEPELHLLVTSLTSQINGCEFCLDLAHSFAMREHLSMEKFVALPDYRISPLFSERERAALAYVEEATRNKHVSDATFEELRRHFNEREIVEITWINAQENFYNLMNLPLGIESDGFCVLVGKHPVQVGS